MWSWHDSDDGEKLYNLVRKARLVYVAQFNKDFSYGVVTPTFEPGGITSIAIPPSKVLTFAMRKVSDDEYSRDSLILGKESHYRFRRLIDADGTRVESTFQEFLDAVETPNALFPVCKADRNPKTLPTVCAQ